MPECSDCGRFFDTDNGFKVHYTAKHGDLPNNVECSWCGTPMREPPSVIERCNNFFCGDECKKEFKQDRKRFNCHVCGESFQRYPSRAEQYDVTICSTDCRDEYQREGEYIKCDECGTSTYKQRDRLEKYNKHFCNQKCKKKYFVGKNHPNYTTGSGDRYYGSNWDRQKLKCKERDSWECVLCGIDNDKHLSKYKCGLTVHHISPYYFSNDNNLYNLITVCTKCHPRIEPPRDKITMWNDNRML